MTAAFVPSSPPDPEAFGHLTVHQHRDGLPHTLAALRRGELVLGFAGGSITEAPVEHNWPEPVIAWFQNQFPGVRLRVENAAVAATGSSLACFRAHEHLISRGCDLVFVEFAVNDWGVPAERRRRTQEGLLRQLLAGEGRDVILAYTFRREMLPEMLAGSLPSTVAGFEELGQHYGLGSVWMGLHALREVRAGRMRWDAWLPDGLHPTGRGSLSYAEAVTTFLARELLKAPSEAEPPAGRARPDPLDKECWERARTVPLGELRTSGPWALRRSFHQWEAYVLETDAPGARIEVDFEGRGLLLGTAFGRRAAEFQFRMDRGEWTEVSRERPDWAGDLGWYRSDLLAEQLVPGRHTCELEVIQGGREDCLGATFRLALVGVVP